MLTTILIILTGILGGLFTTLAGGGSLIVIPALIFLGLSPATANGTSRIGIIIASLAAVYKFKKKGYFNLNLGLILGLPAITGSIIGAKIATIISKNLFNYILVGIMLLIPGLISWNSITDLKTGEIYLSQKRILLLIVIFFVIGIYGGLLQAGVGIIILLTLSLLTGFSLNEINSIKVFVISLYIIPSLLIFTFKNEINWEIGFILAAGNYAGAYLGTLFSFMADTMLVKIIYVICIITLVYTIL